MRADESTDDPEPRPSGDRPGGSEAFTRGMLGACGLRLLLLVILLVFGGGLLIAGFLGWLVH